MKKYLFIFAPLMFVLGSIFFMQGFALQFCFAMLFFSLFFVEIACFSKSATIKYLSIVLFTMGFVLVGTEVYYYVHTT